VAEARLRRGTETLNWLWAMSAYRQSWRAACDEVSGQIPSLDESVIASRLAFLSDDFLEP